jgi:hypothetical protein
MANVLNRTAGVAFPYKKDYRTSVNEPDFPEVDWIWDPDLSAVAGQPSIYWDITGDVVSLVDGATQASRDAEIAAAAVQSRIDSEKARYDNEDILRAVVVLLIDELNLLRAQHSLAARTYAQAKTAVLNAIDGGV